MSYAHPTPTTAKVISHMKTVEISPVVVVRMTGSACLIEFKEEEFWVPRPQIMDYSFTMVDGEEDVDAIWIPEWLAEDKGLL